MKPSAVLNAYRVGQRAARSVDGLSYISRTRLHGWGWTSEKIDALFAAIEKVDELELQFQAIASDLDAKFT